MVTTSSVTTIEFRKTFSSIALAAVLLVQIQVGEVPYFQPLVEQSNAAANPLGASFDTAPSQDSQTDANGNSVSRPSGGTFNCPAGQVVTSIAYLGIQAGNDSTDGLTIACKPINADGTLGSQGAYMFNSDFSGNTRYPQELVQPACSGNSAVQTVYWSDLENNLTTGGRQDALDGEGIGCHPITCAGIGSNEVELHQPGDMLEHNTQPPTSIKSMSCPTGTVAVGVTYDSFGSQVPTDPDATDSVVRLRCAPVSSSFCPAPGVDLSIQKSGPSSVMRGGVASYTISAFNAGPGTATNVTIADPIPSGLVFNSSQSSGNCIQNGSNILCDNLTLGSGQSATVTIAFDVPLIANCTQRSINNTASVSTSATETNPSNNQSQTVTTTLQCPNVDADVSIVKSGPSSVLRGDAVVYTVTVFNAGPATATNVRITDPVPTGLTFNGGQSSSNCVQNNSNIICNNQTLAAGQSATVTLSFNSSPATQNCTQSTVTNRASVSTSSTDPNSSNNQSQTITTTLNCPVVNADLSIAKSGPSFVVRGGVVAYTVTAFNAGPATANTVTITDPIPAGLSFNASQSSANCRLSGANIVCTIPSLSNGQNSTVTIAFNIPAQNNCTQTTLSNTATISSLTNDQNPNNNQSNAVTTTVTCPLSSDLSIVKSGPSSVVRGDNIVYTLTASNAGPSTANNVTITDPIPAGLTFNASQSSSNCRQDGANIVCDHFNLTNGQSATVTLSFTTSAANSCVQTTVNNRASVQSTCPDPNPSNNQSQQVATTITCPIIHADLSITKSGPASVMRGDVIVYTLTASNAGPSTANSVTIVDAIPTGLTFNAGQSSGNCVVQNSSIVCSIASIANGQSATVTLAFNTTSVTQNCTQGTVTNRATVNTSTTDPNSSNNQSNTVTTTLQCPIVNADLSIVKSGPATVLQGDAVLYTLTVSNAGPATANTITITDPMPAGLMFDHVQSSSNCRMQGWNILCDIPSLTNGQSATVTIAFTTTPAALKCTQTTVTNRASVSAASPDPVSSNNQSQTVTTTLTCPPRADLSITKSGPSTVVRGNLISYTLTASNAGPSTANNVTIADPIPAGLVFNPSQSSPNCIQNGTNILCDNLTLTSGQSATVTIAFNTATPGICSPATVTNRASVSTSTTDPNSTNNQSNTVTTTITCPPRADLSIVKSGPATVVRGGVVKYTLNVQNAGPSTATSVVITDPIPGDSMGNFIFNPSQSSPNCVQSGSNIVCTIPSIANGQSASVTLAFTVPTCAVCTEVSVTNTASVTNDVTDSNLTNNQSSAQTTITCPIKADLSIVKSGPSSVMRGDVISYTVTATNAGPSTATSVVITDPIPAGLTFSPGQSSSGCTVSGTNVRCTIATLANGQSSTVTIAFTAPTVNNCSETTVNNTATVSNAVTDPNLTNNQSNTVTTTINCPPRADLSIVKNGPSTVVRGDVISYTLTATNAGPSTANNVTITDPIPSGLIFNPTQSSGNCVQNGVNILCDNLTLTSGQSATVTIAFNTPVIANCSTVTVNNRASVSTSTTDPNSANNQSLTVTTTITCPAPQADLSIVKSGPATVLRGGVVHYTLSAFNAGPNTATNVTIADPIPAGLTFNASQSSPNCVQNGSNILCDNMTLTNGQSATVTIAFNIPAIANCSETTIYNTSSVSTSVTDPNSSNNQSQTVTTTVTCPVINADLSIVKSGPRSVTRGGIILYTLSAFNAGPSTANNVTITDPIPAGLTFNPSQSSGNCVQNGSNILCDNMTLTSGQSATVTIAFDVPNIPNCSETTVNNTASVSTSTTDPNPSNNQSQTVTTTVKCPSLADVSIVKSGPLTVLRGGVATYTLSVFNAGPSTATNVTINDPIPAGLTFNASQSSASCVQQGLNIVCSNLNLLNGQSATVTIAFNVPTVSMCGHTTVQNTATVNTSTIDPNPSNNRSETVQTQLKCPISGCSC